MKTYGRWRAYRGLRAAGPAVRVVIEEDSAGDRYYAYVEENADGWFHAWYEVPGPGEVIDTTIGRYPTKREAQAAVRRFQP